MDSGANTAPKGSKNRLDVSKPSDEYRKSQMEESAKCVKEKEKAGRRKKYKLSQSVLSLSLDHCYHSQRSLSQ